MQFRVQLQLVELADVMPEQVERNDLVDGDVQFGLPAVLDSLRLEFECFGRFQQTAAFLDDYTPRVRQRGAPAGLWPTASSLTMALDFRSIKLTLPAV